MMITGHASPKHSAQVCDVLDLDYEQIKDKLTDPDESVAMANDAGSMLGGIEPEEEPAGGLDE